MKVNGWKKYILKTVTLRKMGGCNNTRGGGGSSVAKDRGTCRSPERACSSEKFTAPQCKLTCKSTLHMHKEKRTELERKQTNPQLYLDISTSLLGNWWKRGQNVNIDNR